MKPVREMNLETTPLPTPRGMFASLRDRLTRRPDTEHQGALIRIAFGVIVTCYLLVVMQLNAFDSVKTWQVMALIAVINLYPISIMIGILIYPQVSVSRRILSVVMDVGTTTYGISLLGDVGAPLFGLYLWNACGNGFRYGSRYLYLSSALSITGFMIVLVTSEYWAAHRALGVGLLIVLFGIPMYFTNLVHQLHTALARMRTMATHDSLTGLPNRHSFYEQLQQKLNLVEESNTAFAVVFVDLDGFKPINDAMGHAAGDAVLKSVAGRLKESVRNNDVVARFGGDEFVIILSNIPKTAVPSTAHKIIDTVAKPHELDGKTVILSSSVGIAIYPDSGRSVDKLVAHADAAMYQAKRGGNNCFCIDGETQIINSPSTHISVCKA